MNEDIEAMIKSMKMRLANADKSKLGIMAKQIYLQGFARLSKAEKVASEGNDGRGFVLKNTVAPSHGNKDKRSNKRGKRKKRT
jgi:hypothetical protein